MRIEVKSLTYHRGNIKTLWWIKILPWQALSAGPLTLRGRGSGCGREHVAGLCSHWPRGVCVRVTSMITVFALPNLSSSLNSTNKLFYIERHDEDALTFLATNSNWLNLPDIASST